MRIARQITRATVSSGGSQLYVSFWAGSYGPRGDGLFCKTECGYSYGIRAALRMKGVSG
jgi:hypothetical protein